MPIEHALPTRRFTAVSAAMFLLSGGGTVHGGEATTQMHVKVAVPRHASIVGASEPACLDRAASETDIKARVAYRVRSTSTSGIELVLQPAAAVRSLSVQVRGTTDRIAIPSIGGSITLRGHPLGESELHVEYEFALNAVAPGDCVSWPVYVDVRPL